MNKSGLRVILWIIVLAGVIASVFVGYQRFLVEDNTKSVEISLYDEDIKTFAKQEGISFAEALSQFKARGATTILFKEKTISQWAEYRDLQVFNGGQLLAANSLGESYPWVKQLVASPDFKADYTYLVSGDADFLKFLASHAETKIPNVTSYKLGSINVLAIPYSYGKLNTIGFGFDTAEFDAVRAQGLLITPQIRSWPNHNKLDYNQAMAVAVKPLVQDEQVSAIMFNDKVLPGVPEHVTELVNVLAQGDKPVVAVEFFPQAGFNTVAKKLEATTSSKRIVRLHSIGTTQMPKYTPATAIDRYELAVTDRNMRILFVRFFEEINGKPVDNFAFVEQLADTIEHDGYSIGKAGQITDPQVSNLLTAVIGLAVIAGGMLVLLLWGLGTGLTLGLGVLGALVWGLLWFSGSALAYLVTKALALLSTIVFPTYAVSKYVQREGRGVTGALAAFFANVATALIGAALMVGLLSHYEFMVKLDQFSGVTIAHVLPLLFVTLFVTYKTSQGQSLVDKVRELIKQPLTVGLALVGVALAGALVVYLLRTGNEAQELVSPLELKLRYFLQEALVARPRTKEFLLGHPLLIWLLYRGYKSDWFFPALLLATIGQISLVNTFAHLHTPLLASLIRMANGVWLGVVFGLLLIVVDKIVSRLWTRLALR